MERGREEKEGRRESQKTRDEREREKKRTKRPVKPSKAKPTNDASPLTLSHWPETPKRGRDARTSCLGGPSSVFGRDREIIQALSAFWAAPLCDPLWQPAGTSIVQPPASGSRQLWGASPKVQHMCTNGTLQMLITAAEEQDFLLSSTCVVSPTLRTTMANPDWQLAKS